MRKSVLLYSGGLDCYLLSQTQQYDTLLHVRMFTGDGEREYELLRKTGMRSSVKVLEMPLVHLELPNKVIPFRNYILAMIAASYGNDIHLGVVAGDGIGGDGDEHIVSLEQHLNHVAQVRTAVQFDTPYRIHVPFMNRTKTENVAYYLESGKPWEKLFTDTRSCYGDGERECGLCPSCVPKFIALVNNGIPTDTEIGFEQQPSTSYLYALSTRLQSIESPRYSEVANALRILESRS